MGFHGNNKYYINIDRFTKCWKRGADMTLESFRSPCLTGLSAMIMITILDSDTYVPEIVLCINAGYLFCI